MDAIASVLAPVERVVLPVVVEVNKLIVPLGLPAMTAQTFLAAVVLVLVVRSVLQGRARGNAPPTLGWVPFFGDVISFGVHPINYCLNAFKKYGDCFSVRMLGHEMVYLMGADAHELFFRTDDETFSVRDAYQWTVKVFGPGVVYHATNDVFVQQLRFLRNGLLVSRLASYVPMIEMETQMYADKWIEKHGKTGVVDMFESMCELTILTASRCLLGEEIRTELNEEFAKLYHDLEGGFTPVGLFFPNAPSFTAGMRARDRAVTEMQKLFNGVIDKRRKDGVVHEDMLQALMDSTYNDGSPLPPHHITGMLVALLFAGQHTSSITASWVGLNVFHHAEKENLLERLMAEQKQVMGSRHNLTPDDLKNMTLLHACMKEVLRMYPPLIQIMRKVVKPIKYKGYDLPIGSLVTIPVAASMRLPEMFDRPNSYEPDRFLPPRSEDKKPFHFLGFGAGRHACLGENFAYLQVKTIWSTLLRRFDWEVVEKDVPLPDYNTMVVGPRQPARLRFTVKA